MVKEKGNYKYRSPCTLAQVAMLRGAAGLGHLTGVGGDDQSKARQTYSWGENLCIVKSSRTFHLAAAVQSTSCIWGVCTAEPLDCVSLLIVLAS